MDIAQAMRITAQRKTAATAPVWESAVVQSPRDATGRVQINSSGTSETALCPASLAPAAGDVVAIARAAAPLVLAILVQASPAPTRWTSGTAQGGKDSTGKVPVMVEGAVVAAVCPVGITPATGDVLAVVRDQTWLVTGILTQANPDSGDDTGGATEPGAPGGGATSGTTKFPAMYTRTWEALSAMQGGGYYVYDGIDVSNFVPPIVKPFWFYQASITSTLKGVTVDSARMRMPAWSKAPTSLTLVFCDEWPTWPTPKVLPSQAYNLMPDNVSGPSSTTVTVSGRGAQWVPIPVAAAQAMTQTQIAVGISSIVPDIVAYGQGVSTDPLSGQIEIRWHR